MQGGVKVNSPLEVFSAAFHLKPTQIGLHLHPHLLRLNPELTAHHLSLCPRPPRLNEEARVRGVCLRCGEHVGADSGHVQCFLSAGV